MFRNTLLLGAIIALAGCASGSRINEDHIDKYKKGVTTEREIKADFGQPSNVQINSDGSKLDIYSGVSKKFSSIAFTFDADGVLRNLSVYGAHN